MARRQRRRRGAARLRRWASGGGKRGTTTGEHVSEDALAGSEWRRLETAALKWGRVGS
jgi:hypothetical protein